MSKALFCTQSVAVMRWLMVCVVALALCAPMDAWAMTPQEAATIITALYAELLHRAPDPVGLHGWSDFLVAGGTVAQLRAAILASAEYQARQAAAQAAREIPLVYPVLPPGLLSGMQAQMILNSQPITCASGEREALIPNLSGRTVEIRLVRQWHGASAGSIVDLLSSVFRASDHMLVAFFGQDRYSNPGGLTHADTAFAVPFLLPAGDALRIQYACGSPTITGIQAHVVTALWWTWGP